MPCDFLERRLGARVDDGKSRVAGRLDPCTIDIKLQGMLHTRAPSAIPPPRRLMTTINTSVSVSAVSIVLIAAIVGSISSRNVTNIRRVSVWFGPPEMNNATTV